MTDEFTEHRPEPEQRNQALAETDGPRTIVRPDVPTAFSRRATPTPPGPANPHVRIGKS